MEGLNASPSSFNKEIKMKKTLNILYWVFGFAVIVAIFAIPELFPAGVIYGAIAVYTKACTKNVSGNSALYWCEVANITSFTITTGEISAVTPATGKKFFKAGAEIDTIIRTEEGVGTISNISYKHRIEAKFNKPSTALNTLRNSLADASPCGILAIVTDSNGTSWLVGYNATDGKNRPLRLVTDSVTSGAVPSEAEGSKLLIALETENGYVCLPFDSTLGGQISGGTATFITYA